MFGSILIEKMLEDATLSVFENENNYEIVLNSKEILFQIHKESLSINLDYGAWELVAQNEETSCNKVLCSYLKLNYLVQNGLFRMLVDGNTTSTEWISLNKVQRCMSLFKDFNIEKSKELTVNQLQIMRTYGIKMHHTFNLI